MLVVLLSGCGEETITRYQIPKEERTSATEPPTPATAPAAAPAKMQVMPGMKEQAEAAGDMSWSTPEGWDERAPSGIRKGTFVVNNSGGSAEVTVLAFPGDVGGDLANLNRWLGQVGRQPVTAAELDQLAPEASIAGHPGRKVRLEGGAQSILGAFIRVDGYTWFVKMLGDSDAVLAEADNMDAFLDSIRVGGAEQ